MIALSSCSSHGLSAGLMWICVPQARPSLIPKLSSRTPKTFLSSGAYGKCFPMTGESAPRDLSADTRQSALWFLDDVFGQIARKGPRIQNWTWKDGLPNKKIIRTDAFFFGANRNVLLDSPSGVIISGGLIILDKGWAIRFVHLCFQHLMDEFEIIISLFISFWSWSGVVIPA